MEDLSRFIFECILLGLLFCQLVLEVVEIYNIFASGGDVLAEYFMDFWQVLDTVSLCLFFGVFYTWFVVFTPKLKAFNPQVRYNVYLNLDTPADLINNVDMVAYKQLNGMLKVRMCDCRKLCKRILAAIRMK